MQSSSRELFSLTRPICLDLGSKQKSPVVNLPILSIFPHSVLFYAGLALRIPCSIDGNSCLPTFLHLLVDSHLISIGHIGYGLRLLAFTFRTLPLVSITILYNMNHSARNRNSESIPGVLTSALKTLSERKALKVSAPVSETKKEINKLPIRIAMKRCSLTHHGAGVYEDAKNGDIWYREGEFLIRQAIDVNKIVEQYIESCQGE